MKLFAACVSVLIAVCLTLTVCGCNKSTAPGNAGATSPDTGSSSKFKKAYNENAAKQQKSKGP